MRTDTQQRLLMPVLVTLLLAGLAGCASTEQRDQVTLTLSEDGRQLGVSYRFGQATTAMLFARNPDDSRSVHWHTASTDFEIVRDDGKEFVRRTDGGYFSAAELIVPAAYRPLPKDYAAFSPFSDGGLLVHSGRFQVCPIDAGEDQDECEGPWPMQVVAPSGAHIYLNGRRYERSARWLDTRDGTKIYVGAAQPAADGSFIQVVDRELPSEISSPLSVSLPEIMAYYEQALSPLVRRPMLYVSYDPDYEHGHGHQGGTLPDQIFMHFYGPAWREGSAKQGAPEDLLWFFAHEAGHLFQHDVSGNRESSWIHEGSADAFAYLSLEALNLVPAAYLDKRRRQAVAGCRSALDKGPLTEAAGRGEFSSYYDCGLIVFLAIDDAIGNRNNGQQNLFDFWSMLIADSPGGERWDSAEFLAYTKPWAGDELSQALLTLVTAEHGNHGELLDTLGMP